MTKAPLTTHVLDLKSGRPAAGLEVRVYKDGEFAVLAQAFTDSDGRINHWNTDLVMPAGDYRIEFSTGPWFSRQQLDSIYPLVQITFTVSAAEHYHIPLLLSPFGYSTYRGS